VRQRWRGNDSAIAILIGGSLKATNSQDKEQKKKDKENAFPG
jgi:hypothetical protein